MAQPEFAKKQLARSYQKGSHSNLMPWSAAVVTARTADTSPSILVSCDSSTSAKYLFGCSEGTSRGFLESTSRWIRTRAVFVSRSHVEDISGLAGVIMSLSDGVPKLDVIGPPGVDHAILAMRTHVMRNTIDVNPVEIPVNSATGLDSPSPAFRDRNITIYAIPANPAPNTEVPGDNDLETVSAANVRHTEPADSLLESYVTWPHTSLARAHDPGLKRERTPSPPSTSKRRIIEGSRHYQSLSQAQNIDRKHPTLNRSPRSRQQQICFTPELREGMLNRMFPQKCESVPSDLSHVRPPPPQKKVKGAVAVEPVPKPTGPQFRPPLPRPPPGYYNQLPPLNNQSGFAADGKPRNHVKPVLSWVFEGLRVPGKFDVAKSIALGVPHGPLRGQLVAGKAVSFEVDDPASPGGKKIVEVTPDQVVGPSSPPAVGVILNCPSIAYIDALVEQISETGWLSRYLFANPEERKPHVVFHICGPDVLDDDRYKALMKTFPSDVEHVVSSADHDANPISFPCVAANQVVLHTADPHIFPVLSTNTSETVSLVKGLPDKITPLRANLVVGMHPLTPPQVKETTANKEIFHPVLSKPIGDVVPEVARQIIETAGSTVATTCASRPDAQQPGHDVQIVPLGSGSAVATRYRSVSGTLIRIPNRGTILLDAGEGTWGQLARTFGLDTSQPNNAWDVLRDIKCISISHPHGDHQIGVPMLLAKRAQLDPPPKDPLWVIAGRTSLLTLREFAELGELGMHPSRPGGVRLINGEALHYTRSDTPDPSAREKWHPPWYDGYLAQVQEAQMSQLLGLDRFETVTVDHGSCRCLGAVIISNDGWKIAFSADTQPSDELVDAGAGATLLIHEGTFGDDQAEYARVKYHSTVGEALDVARRMKAENTLLTHFSARYPHLAPRTQEKAHGTLALASDSMRLRIGDMWKMPIYAPAIEQALMATFGTEDEDASMAMAAAN